MKDNIITMLMQVFAIAIAGVTVGALLQSGVGAGASVHRERARGRFGRVAAWLRRHAGGLAITIAVIAAFSFWTQAWDFWVSRTTERRSYSGLTARASAYADASVDKPNMPFLEFVRERIPADGRYAIVAQPGAHEPFARQWSSYVLIPRLLTDEKHADAIVIVDTDPKKADYDRKRFPILERFSRRYAIALPEEDAGR